MAKRLLLVMVLLIGWNSGVALAGDYRHTVGDLITVKAFDAPLSVTELVKVLRLASKYLNKSDDVETVPAVYYPPATRLRMMADEMEQKDRDIDYIRGVLEKAERAIKAMNGEREGETLPTNESHNIVKSDVFFITYTINSIITTGYGDINYVVGTLRFLEAVKKDTTLEIRYIPYKGEGK